MPVPILTYHSLDETGSVISISPTIFQAQMRALHDQGFQAIRLIDLLNAWERGEIPWRRPVVLTFDDGFRNLLEAAVPILSELNFRATIFAVAGHCGRLNDWASQPPGVPRLRLLSYSELRELARIGFEVGAHGMTHAPLLDRDAATSRWEIAASRRTLEDGIGQSVFTFAYPYGIYTEAVVAAVAAEYWGACGVSLRWARPEDDRHRLPRVDAYYLKAMPLFRRFATPLGRAYLGCRSLLRDCRSAAYHIIDNTYIL